MLRGVCAVSQGPIRQGRARRATWANGWRVCEVGGSDRVGGPIHSPRRRVLARAAYDGDMSSVRRWVVYTGSIVLFAALMEARHQAPNALLRAALAGAAAVALLPVLRMRASRAAQGPKTQHGP